MSDIRNLGVFATVKALWAAHPEGGQEGDYAYIGASQAAGTKYRWNKYDRIWENKDTVTQSAGRRNFLVEGDQEVTGDMLVLGTLRAKHVKQPHMGMYASADALVAAIPNPEKGWYALVGNTLPAELYVCNTAGTWTDTGNEYDGEDVDLTNYVTAEIFQDYTNRGYKLLGDATPSTNPSSPTAGDAYLASTPGTYANFGGTVLADGQMAMFKYNGSAWSASILSTGKNYDEEISDLDGRVFGKDISTEDETNLLGSANTVWRMSSGGSDLTATALNRAASTSQSFFLNITAYRGDSLRILGNANYTTYVYFLTRFPDSSVQEAYTFQELIDAGYFASNHFNQEVFSKCYVSPGVTKTFQIPDDASYLFVSSKVIEDNLNRVPQYIHLISLTHTPGIIDEINGSLSALAEEQGSIGDSLQTLDDVVFGTLQEISVDGFVFAKTIPCSIDKTKFYRVVSTQRAIAIDVSGFKKITIIAGVRYAYMCIANNNLDISERTDYSGSTFASTYMATGCDGYVPNNDSSYRMRIDAGSSVTITLSENAKWLILQMNFSDTSIIYTPESVSLKKDEYVGGLVNEDKTGNISASNTLISLTQGYLDEQGKMVEDFHYVITSPIPMSRGFYIDLHEPYRVHGVMLFDNNGNLVNPREYYNSIDSPNAGLTRYGLAMILPQFYVRLRIGTSISGGMVKESDNIIRNFAYLDDSRLRKMIPSDSDTAAVMGVAKRRVRSLLDVVWTALENASITNSTSSYARKGQVMHGVPYSEAAEYTKYVGQHISVRTFLTAALNKRSVVYTETINSVNPVSKYGLSYHGLSTLSGAYYGTVCSGLTCFVQDLADIKVSGTNANCTRIAGGDDTSEENYYPLVEGVDPFDLIEPLDLIWYTGHITIVTDVYLDENGEKKFFVWTEQTTPRTMSAPYTKEKFKERIIERMQQDDRHAWAIYRYNKWGDGLSEPEATPHVQQDFFEYSPKEAPSLDPDITTFAGEYAAFPIGNPGDQDNNNKLYLNIRRGGNDGYTHLQIFAETDDETSASPIIERGISQSDNYVAQSTLFSEDAAANDDWILFDLASYWFDSQSSRAGKFKARVVRKESGSIVMNSGCTHFQMVDISFQVVRGSGTITCSYSSTEGNCYLIRQEKPDGMANNNSAIDGDGTTTLSWNSFGTYKYVKLFVRADYGVVVKRIDMTE